ncbi:flagellin [Sphingomonas montana]|uniref:flagellin n=1 Tax=Sphingomonas montana TaxID=1843236 RepID=UPI00096F4046|nr:hypothetical protein [Sphingomonas montana]
MITPRNRFSPDLNRSAQLRQTIDRLSTQLATQKSVQVASDDPQAAVRISGLRRDQANNAAYAANADTAATLATRADAGLANVTTRLDRARELTLQAATDTYTPEQRAGMATELRGIAADIAAATVQKDSRGQDVFPAGAPARFPIAAGTLASGTVSRDTVFAGVATAAGPASIADILEAAAVAAESGSPSDRSAAVVAVAAASAHVIDAHAAQGMDAARIDRTRETIAEADLSLTDARAGVEGVDTAALITLIQQKMTTLDIANQVFGKINAKSLFDVLG